MPVPSSAPPSDSTAPSDPTWIEVFAALPRGLRWTAYVSLGLVGMLIVSLLTALVVVRQPLPKTQGTLDLPGLDSQVTVVRDDHGIPQLYGDTVGDLMRAQGFVHAQERFWEMDVRRHATSGRLSELFGEASLETDMFVRTLGWREVAEREVALLSPDTRDAFEAYADGVNAYVDQRSTSDLGLEYLLLEATGLDYEPEPWRVADSLAWFKAMAWDLRGNMGDEIDRVLALSMNSPEQVGLLFPEYDANRFPPIVDQGAVVDGVFDQDAKTGDTRRLRRTPSYLGDPGALDRLRDLKRALDRLPEFIGRGPGVGSNSWVVDGDHTATGQPLLANDPHLSTSVPGIWMQMGLHCRTVSADCPLDVAGFTFSGVPGVIIGHNADIAWGFTNLGPDVTDLYLEKVEGDSWRHAGTLRPLRIRRETIKVRGRDDVRISVRATAHGPLLSGVSEELAEVGRLAGPEQRRPSGGYAIALAWTALDPTPTADAVLALNTARDWESFREAAASFATPSQNLVYADRAGHIGYQAPGRIPIRGSGNSGLLPAEGWRPSDDWTGQFVPFEALPSLLDPEEGYVVTANQQVIGTDDYPYFLGDDWAAGYRARRITDLIQTQLAAGGELTVTDMARLQLDDRHPMAPTLVPLLLEQELPEGYDSAGQRLLVDWDYSQPAQSRAAAYFNAVWRNLLELTFHDDLPEEAWPEGGGRWMRAVEGLLLDPDNAFWDDRETDYDLERRDDIVRAAMLAAREELTRLEARNPDDWEWGHLHQLDLEHQTLGTSGIAAVEWLFNRGDWLSSGGGSSVNATAWDATEGYGVTAAPSMRMVVSLADWDQSRWINLTGVSGHPASDHYTDQTELWVRGETLPWRFSREAVESAAEDTLVLQPSDG